MVHLNPFYRNSEKLGACLTQSALVYLFVVFTFLLLRYNLYYIYLKYFAVLKY